MQWLDVALTKSPESQSVLTLFHHLQQQGSNELSDPSAAPYTLGGSFDKLYVDGLTADKPATKNAGCESEDDLKHQLDEEQPQGSIYLDNSLAHAVVSPYCGCSTSKFEFTQVPNLDLSIDFDTSSLDSTECVSADVLRSDDRYKCSSDFQESPQSSANVDSPESPFSEQSLWHLSQDSTSEFLTQNLREGVQVDPQNGILKQLITTEYLQGAKHLCEGFRNPMMGFDLTAELAINENLLNEHGVIAHTFSTTS